MSATPTTSMTRALPRLNSSPSWYSYLKIGEGCSNCCSYCIIPRLRGAYRSRPLEALVAEAERLVARGVKEINVISQDITRYGSDLADGSTLESLLRRLAAIDGLRWIRLLYAYPDGITDGLIRLIRDEPKICKYLDIPIQHISDPVLKAMKRRSSEGQIRDLIAKLRRRDPRHHPADLPDRRLSGRDNR